MKPPPAEEETERIGADDVAAAVPDEREAWAVLLSVHGLGPAGSERSSPPMAAAGPSSRRRRAAGRRARFARIVGAATAGRRTASWSARAIVAVRVSAAGAPRGPARSSGLRIVTLDDPGVSRRASARSSCRRPVLLVRGAWRRCRRRARVAIVGTRRPTERGRLRRRPDRRGRRRAGGASVVSGLAVGIDGAAHAAAVAADGVRRSRSSARVTTGSFPRAHQRLAAEIVGERWRGRLGAVAGAAAVQEHVSPAQPGDQRPGRRDGRGRGRGAERRAHHRDVGARAGPRLVPRPGADRRATVGSGCLAWLREFAGEARIVAAIPELLEPTSACSPRRRRTTAWTTSPPGRSGSRPPRAGLAEILDELGPTAGEIGRALVDGNGSLDELVAATEPRAGDGPRCDHPARAARPRDDDVRPLPGGRPARSRDPRRTVGARPLRPVARSPAARARVAAVAAPSPSATGSAETVLRPPAKPRRSLSYCERSPPRRWPSPSWPSCISRCSPAARIAARAALARQCRDRRRRRGVGLSRPVATTARAPAATDHRPRR